MNAPLLLIRADAGPDIGTGHVMRMIALAQQWRAAGGRVTFLSRCEFPGLRQRIQNEGFAQDVMPQAKQQSTDLARTLDAASQAAWVALDGYHFDPGYQKALRDAGHRTLVLDDNHHWPEYHADILLNQNIGAEDRAYRLNGDALQLLGLRYALLRQEFLRNPGRARACADSASRVLISLGGAPPPEAVRTVIHGLLAIDRSDLETVIVGHLPNDARRELQSLLDKAPLRARLDGSKADMPDLMAWADVGIFAAGSTCWEAAFMGLPMLVGTTADNQEANALALAEQGLAETLGPWRQCPPQAIAGSLAALLGGAPLRRTRGHALRRRVDGLGAERTVRLMRLLDERELDVEAHVRPAHSGDCVDLWRLANEPASRANSFSTEPIGLAEHRKWFAGKLAAPGVRLYVLECNGCILGQARYEQSAPGVAIISYALATALHGRGLGRRLVRTSALLALRELGTQTLLARVKRSNPASIRCLEASGFFQTSDGDGEAAVLTCSLSNGEGGA